MTVRELVKRVRDGVRDGRDGAAYYTSLAEALESGCHRCGGRGLVEFIWRDGTRTCIDCCHEVADARCEATKRGAAIAGQKAKGTLTRGELDRLNEGDGILASDAERSAVVDRLTVAAGEGRLTPEGLEARVSLALEARRKPVLDALVRDLPALPESEEPRRLSPATKPTKPFYIGRAIACIGCAILPAAFLFDPSGVLHLVGYVFAK